ncbi:MAG: SDR family oxidoreductase [Spirochaetales bacterium]|nr:SDR family oxidoreductase [Spirochaetales bacterium]
MKSIRERYGGWALVTGASAGIGETFARRLAEEGLDLILAARRIDRLLALQTDLEKSHGINVLPLEIDLTADDFLPRLVSAVGDRPVGVLVNNAGFGLNGDFLDNDPDREADMVLLNCLAPLKLTRHFARLMADRGKGAIIFLSSIGANQPAPQNVTYAATKAFDLFLGEGLSYELKRKGIDVLTVMPGPTRTEFQEVGNYTAGSGMRAPHDVVRTALRSLGKRMSVTDGFGNKFMTFFARRMPRKWVIAAAAAYIKGFSNDK